MPFSHQAPIVRGVGPVHAARLGEVHHEDLQRVQNILHLITNLVTGRGQDHLHLEGTEQEIIYIA